MTKERVKKIRSSMNKLLYEKEVVSVVDIFIDLVKKIMKTGDLEGLII